MWTRKQLLVVALSGSFCLASGGRYLWRAYGPSAWGPRVACREVSFDCGEVSADRSIEHSFVIHNSGRRPLRILAAEPGCGSSVKIGAFPNEIAANGAAVINATIPAGKLAQGEFDQRLMLRTNAANAPKVMLFLKGKVVGPSSPPAAAPAAPQVVSLPARRLATPLEVDGLEEALEKLRPSGAVPLSGLLHACHVFGFDVPLTVAGDPPETLRARDVILDHAAAVRYFGEGPLIATRNGVRCRVTARRNVPLQPAGVVHAHQLLALLALHGESLDTPLSTAQGGGKVRDVLADGLANFSLAQDEVEWAAIAFALYLAPRRAWTDKFGQSTSFDDLARRLLGTSFDEPQLACEGIHVLQALAVLAAVDRQRTILSDDVRAACVRRLQEQAELVVQLQQASGALTPLWHATAERRLEAEGVLNADEQRRRALVVTGHHLEWLLLLPPESAPDDDVFLRGGRWLYEQLRAASPADIEAHYCPYSHAGCMVLRFSARSDAAARRVASRQTVRGMCVY